MRRGCRCSATARVLTDDHNVRLVPTAMPRSYSATRLPASERRTSVKEAAVLDLLIRDASIVDGTGAPTRHGDVGDRGGAGYGLRTGREKKTGTNVSVVRAETSPWKAE